MTVILEEINVLTPTCIDFQYFSFLHVTGGEKNIGLDRDSNPGPQEYRSCTLPLSYRTTCRFASRYITKYLYTATYTPSKLEFSPEFWRQRNMVKCSQGAEAEANHNVGCPTLGAKCNRWWKKYRARPGLEPRASGIPFLHSTTELSNHMSICLTIYHQIPVHGYIHMLTLYSIDTLFDVWTTDTFWKHCRKRRNCL